MHILRIHPALKPSQRGPLVAGMPLHLHQSDLDGACGPHCMLMALMILGVLKRTDLGALPKAKSRSLSQLWWATERGYFSGTTASDLTAMLNPYEGVVQANIFRKNQIARLSDVIEDGGVAIVCIYSEVMNHWVLAVGLGGRDSDAEQPPKNFLILDPGYSVIPLSAWNATLSARADAHERYGYETRHSRHRVHIGQVIGLKRLEST